MDVTGASATDSLAIPRQRQTRQRAKIQRARAIRSVELLGLVSFRTGFGLGFAIDSPKRRSRCRRIEGGTPGARLRQSPQGSRKATARARPSPPPPATTWSQSPPRCGAGVRAQAAHHNRRRRAVNRRAWVIHNAPSTGKSTPPAMLLAVSRPFSTVTPQLIHTAIPRRALTF